MPADHSFSTRRGPVQPPPAAVETPDGFASSASGPPAVRLPNAMNGREYAVGILPLFNRDAGPVEAASSLPPGLKIDEGKLRGTPETAGEFEIRLRQRISSPEGEDVEFAERLLTLTINADPRSLWKNLPSDSSAEFWKPDAAAEFLEEGPLAVLGASLRGRSHAHAGGFRDDDFAMTWFPAAGWYVLSVADGAGSARFSRRGSEIACDAVRRHFAACFAEGPDDKLTRLAREFSASPDDPNAAGNLRKEFCRQFKSAAQQALRIIESQAVEAAGAVRDFHTTLITAMLHPLADGRWLIAVFSIGDGAGAVVGAPGGAPGGAPCLLTKPDGGDYAGQTVFLTMPEALATEEAVADRLQMAVLPKFDALLLVTDGISDPRFESDKALADPAVWTGLWSELQALTAAAGSSETASAALLKWMEFHSPGHHDDRTLLLAALPATLFSPIS